MVSMIVDLKEDYGEVLGKENISLKGLEGAINNFATAARQFHIRLSKVDKTQ
jgi:hypothetical protein